MDSKEEILYDDGTHKCVMFSFDDETHEDSYLSVNQYLIINDGTGMLIDPGSGVIFDELYDAVSQHIDVQNIKYIFFSHQDPDVSGSISEWAISTSAKFIMSSLWVRFMSHYGFMQMNRVMQLPDHGAKLKLGDGEIMFIPAHFLHSPGNFSLYDSKSKIVFCGDIGAAVVSSPQGYKKVQDFSSHKKYLVDFHQRYMASNKVCRSWVKRVKKLPIDILAPQHGFVFEGDKVEAFLEWFKELKCGSDLIDY